MKKITLIHFFLIIIFTLGGCGGGGSSLGLPGGSWETSDGNVPIVAGSQKSIEVNGSFTAPAAPGSAPSYSAELPGGRFTVSVIDKDNPAVEAGIVSAGANSYRAVIPAAAVNRHAMVILTEVKSKKVLYRNILGKVPKVNEFPSNVNRIVLNGISLNETSTARALFAIEKGVADIPIASVSTSEVQSGGIITKDYTSSKTDFDAAAENIAGGAANISQMANAVQAVVAVLTSSAVNESNKNVISPVQINNASALLSAYVNSLKNPSAQAVITSGGLAASVKIGETAINSATNPAGITAAVANITPIAAASAPIFQPAGGSYDQDVNLTITTATQGAIIRYTLDGSTPSATLGNIYASPVTISNTTTVKAVALKSGYSDSPVSTASYTLPNKAAAPVISPGSATYTTAQAVNIITSTAGAVIKFTLDGSAPSETNGLVYSGAFTVSSTATVKAIAIKSGVANSNITSASFVINTEKAATPVFSPAGGTYSTAQSVTITSVTPDAIIKYTTDGSAPSSSNGLNYSDAISISATATIKAVAIKTNMADSDAAAAVYTIQQAVSTPIFNPPAGSYDNAQSVSIISATSGATVFYTLNGSDPSILSNQYTSAVSITSTTTIKAIAVKSGMTTSAVSSAAYTVMQKVSAPVFNPAAGSYSGTQSVSITSATSSASIHYTLDNSTPTAASAAYTSAVDIASTTILKAVAVKSGMTNSDISMAAYTISFPPAADPQFSVASGTYNSTQSVSITSATSNASIYYTLDSSTPTSASNLYTSAISIASTAIIRAIAIKSGMANSNVNAASYIIDRLAPSFNIDYYSDSALALSLGTNPRLSAGTYYLKITADKELQSAPTVSIAAEGSANDVTNAAASSVSGYSYKYTRVIASDAAAVGSVIEDISISATAKAGTAVTTSPLNESTKAAYTDTVAPVATITYSPAAAVKQGAALTINAVISENLMNPPSLKMAISDANTLAATDMTRTDATHYTYSHTVGAGNGSATIALSNAKDLAGNAITAAPVNPSFVVDNTAPTAPAGVTITPAGGNVVTNTVNLTNTNMTAGASITAGQATGGSAQLLIDGVVKAHDMSIAAGDTTVAFDLAKTTTGDLQATIPVALNGKTVTVKVIDAAGNETTSSVANPVITVDYTAPTAPTGVSITPVGGTVIANTLNSTNTNMTAQAAITAGQAADGYAQLLVDGVVKAQDTAILAADATVVFTLSQTTNAGVQGTIPVALNGKTVSVKLIDAAGNETISSASNPAIAVDYTAPTGSLSYVPSAAPSPGTSLSIIAAFSEPIKDSPVMQIAIAGANTLSATDMSKTSSTSYAYIHTVGNGSTAANVTFSTGTDIAGNPITAAPTGGASFTVTNTIIPAGVYKKVAALANINDTTISGNDLTIRTAGFDAVYNVTSNATVISVMGQLPAGNTFTIDSTGKVSAIDASLATGTPSIALTATQCAAGINVKGFSNAVLTLSGSAASQAININITGGTVNVSDTNLTGTVTMNTAAAATITSGAKSITVGATAAASAIAITGTAGGSLSVDAAASNVTINEIKVDPSGTATIAVTGANAISAAGGNINFVINATTGTAAKTFAFTGATAQTGTISAGASETANGLTITAAAGTSAGAITITGGKVDVSDANLTGSVTMDANAIASIISGAKSVTVGAAAAANAVAITGTAGGSVSVDAAASSVTINEIKVDPSGTATITVTSANAISVAGGNINFAINATTDTAAKTFAFTGATAQTGTISAGASETTNGLTITAAAGTSAGAITITGGKVDVSDANLTGAISAATAASIITAGTKNVTASVANVEIISAGTVDAAGNALKISNANTVTLAAAGTVTKTGAGALTINLSNGNVGAINVTGSPAITINNTATNTPRTVGNITLATGTLTINAGAGTSHITVGQTLGVTNGAVTINGGAANVEIGNIATSGALTISAGSGTVKTGTYSGTPVIAGGGTGLITLGVITGNVTVTGHATADLNIDAVTATSVNITTGAATVTVGAITGNASVTDAASSGGAVNFGTISGTLGITSANNSPINVALGANAVSGITTIAGGTTAGNKVTLTGTGVSGNTNITTGHVNIEGVTNSTIGVTGTAGTTDAITVYASGRSVTLSGANLAGANDAVTIDTVLAPAVTAITVSDPVKALTVNKVVTTLSINAANTKVIATATAGTTGIAVGDVTGTVIETAVNTITVNLAGITTNTNTAAIKATAAGVNTLAVTMPEAAGGAEAVTGDIPGSDGVPTAITATIKTMQQADAITGATTQYTVTNSSAVVAYKIASGVTVTFVEAD